MKTKRPQSRNIQLTAAGARELFESAVEHLYDNAEATEIHDIRTWRTRLLSACDTVAEENGADWAEEVGA